MINNQTNQLFLKMSFYLEKEENENAAYTVINTIECLATQFRPDQICEAKNFQYRWEEIKHRLKVFCLTTDFDKKSHEIDESLEVILEPEKWENKIDSRKNGSYIDEVKKASNFFMIITFKDKASV